MREQDAHILDGRDQVILDLLTPEPTPASSFEVMIVGRIGKTAFDQVLAPSCDCATRRDCSLVRVLHLGELVFRAAARCVHGGSECIEHAKHRPHTLWRVPYIRSFGEWDAFGAA